MKKAIGQTVRDLKRGVNKKVLKVPGIEQKVLDSTSNEPWGPHGSLLADIAQASRNPHEYQMIMSVIWKRINDTGKNWRHVYKALTVLEYLVAHGSERVIDDIREHAYQISTLSEFHYVDSSGRDQGINVRKKSQGLVLLVNDKEKIIEVRQKAAVNRDKFRNTSGNGMYRPGSGSGAYGDRYNDDRYGNREEDRNGYGYGRESEPGYRDDDRYSRDGDRYGREYEERYGRDDDYRGRSQSVDYQYDTRSRSSDRDRDDDGQYSSRGSSAKAEDNSLEARLEKKLSEQNMGAPPSYEDAVDESRSPAYSETDVETSVASAPRDSSPHVNDNPSQISAPTASSTSTRNNPTEVTAVASTAASGKQGTEATDDFFDPRVSTTGGTVTSNNVEMDFLGSLSDSFSSNEQAFVPATAETATHDGDAHTGSTTSFAGPSPGSGDFNQQSFEDPFGDTPFKAVPSNETAPSQPQTFQNLGPSQSSTLNADSATNFGFGDSFSVVSYSAAAPGDTHHFSSNSQFLSQDFSSPHQEIDILADILPPAPSPEMASQHNFSAPAVSQQPPPFSSSSSQMASPFSEPTGQLSQQGFSATTSLPTQPFSLPTGQFSEQAFSSPAVAQASPSFPASSNQMASPFSEPTDQLSQLGFSAATSQPTHAFSVPTGQLPQQALSASTSQYAQQPFTSHAGQPDLHAFSSSTGNFMLPPFTSQGGQPAQSSGHMYSGFHPQDGSFTSRAPHASAQSQNGYAGAMNSGNYLPQGSTASIPSQVAPQAPMGQLSQNANFTNYGGPSPHSTSHMVSHSPTLQASQFNSQSFMGQQGSTASFSSPLPHQSLVPSAAPYAVSASSSSMFSQPAKDKFETKSTVWADTLSRGLVNLNISGPKTNPLADIGVDFDSINRKEKRMEKPTTTTVASTVTMGKAMGAGSGIGRAGASALRAPQNPMMGSGIGMGMGMGMNNGPGAGMGMGMNNGPGAGMGMGGYGGMNPSMGMGMGMGMGQGVQMQPPIGIPPGSNMPGNYNNPMMGPGSYTQQPYGGYR